MRNKFRTFLAHLSPHHLAFRRWYGRLARSRPNARRLMTIMLALLIVASTFLVANTTSASYTNVLTNGSFEQGFYSQPGCGMVGNGWGCFNNGGAANYGFYDEQWDPVVADGEHGQLLEINTKGIQNGDADRYAGLFQTVRVVDWANYTLNLRGMIRTTALEGDPWRYRVEVGWTAGRHASWGAVTNWVDAGWDKYYERTAPGELQNFSTNLMAEDDFITIYIRVWKKWGVPEEEIDVNFDAITLTGPAPYGGPWVEKPGYHEPRQPEAPKDYHPWQPGHADKRDYPDKPWQPDESVGCAGPDLTYNGQFEQGFIPVSVGHVGRSWGYFTNGGAANYGFYDEQWPPVVANGSHGQLIEINSKGINPTDADRYAGIFQRIGYLQKGATYELSLRGLLRGAGNEDDPYRFAAQWGYNAGGDTDWSRVDNWQEMDLGPIYPRTEPGVLGTYTVRFKAPASEMVIFIRGWKKWAISEVEMDFNLDAISLRGCGPERRPHYDQPDYDWHPQPPPQDCIPCQSHYEPPAGCEYVVQPGDALSWIAQDYGVSTEDLMYANGIRNPNFIYVGQTLSIPGCAGGNDHSSHGYERPPAKPAPHAARTHVVRAGETLSQICEHYGTDPYALAAINGITNWDLIYVGQVLELPG